MRIYSQFSKLNIPPPAIHLFVWLFIYIVPTMLIPLENRLFREAYLLKTFSFAAMAVCFYVNYLFLVPRYLYAKRAPLFLFFNIIVLSFFLLLSYFLKDYILSLNVIPKHEMSFPAMFIKAFFGHLFITTLAILLRAKEFLSASETEKQKLKAEALHSELTFLKMQLSPHFLFNTLNNILELIEENKESAKLAVQQLSKLLRIVLYESKTDTISIKQEFEFLQDYSNLMRLRYGEKLDFKLTAKLEEPEVQIAPLLLVSFLENAFKHGISAEESFIHINIYSSKNKIIYESKNSYNPKTTKDKSGSGIGLTNTIKRLQLLYEKKFNYDSKIFENQYITKLELTM